MRMSPTCAMLRRSPSTRAAASVAPIRPSAPFFSRRPSRLIRQPNRARQPVRRFGNSVDASAHQRLRRIRPSVAAMPHDAVHRETARDLSAKRALPYRLTRRTNSFRARRENCLRCSRERNRHRCAPRIASPRASPVSLRIRLCLAAPSPHGVAPDSSSPTVLRFAPDPANPKRSHSRVSVTARAFANP